MKCHFAFLLSSWALLGLPWVAYAKGVGRVRLNQEKSPSNNWQNYQWQQSETESEAKAGNDPWRQRVFRHR